MRLITSTLGWLLFITSTVTTTVGCSDLVSEERRNVAPSATTDAKPLQVANRPDGWDDYWYSGLAEINSYAVEQERYGEVRQATEVLVFVTEPFLLERQVKDDGIDTDDESISVFKLNRMEKFTTGIYDYSLMLSVFTPVSYDRYPHTLKTTFSAQDWCGQVWHQINRRSGKFQVETRSYFQGEGDERQAINADYLEDELVSRVRIDPASLPSGKTRLIPSAKFSRLRHVDTGAANAVVSFGESPKNAETRTLSIEYPDVDRSIEYRFDAQFPHRLLGWTERYQGKVLSEASLKKTLREPYWQQNGTKQDGKRAELGLD